MISKKRADQEEQKRKKHNQPTDNKETKDKEVTEAEEQSDASAVADKVKKQEAAEAETGEATDKVMADTAKLSEKLSEMQDKYLRLSAEFDNYRKRTLREKIELSKFAGENILTAILPFMDDFERALKHMEVSDNSNAVREGINLIYQKLTEFLKQNGVKEIDCTNGTFNVDLHEAVGMVPLGEDNQKGKVIEVVLKGYYLNDKVIRHSKVLVGE